MKTLLPCFHPTTTVFIDDDVDTLASLVQALGMKSKSHQTFDDPRLGVAHLNKDTYGRSLLERLIKSEDENLENVLNIDFQVCFSELANPARYNQASTLIVDYEMPGMNGLQVCESVKNPLVRKIMLTGVADESVGIQAFNQGLIYQYVRKQDPNFLAHLNQVIRRAQDDYFKEIYTLLLQILRHRSDATALFEPAFKQYFEDLCATHAIEEYYMVEETGSFLMIDNQKRMHSLITLSDDIIEGYVVSPAMDLLTPEQAQAIEARTLIPCHYDPYHKPGFGCEDSVHFLHSPQVIYGATQRFFCAFGQDFIAMISEDVVVRG